MRFSLRIEDPAIFARKLRNERSVMFIFFCLYIINTKMSSRCGGSRQDSC